MAGLEWVGWGLPPGGASVSPPLAWRLLGGRLLDLRLLDGQAVRPVCSPPPVLQPEGGALGEPALPAWVLPPLVWPPLVLLQPVCSPLVGVSPPAGGLGHRRRAGAPVWMGPAGPGLVRVWQLLVWQPLVWVLLVWLQRGGRLPA